MINNYLMNHEKLQAFASRIFQKMGVLKEHADSIAEGFVDADLRGVPSHGVHRIIQYFPRIKGGGLNIRPNIKIVNETSVTAVIDGDYASGYPVSQMAIELARKKANEHGLAYVAVRNMEHFGMAALWSRKLAENDMIGLTGSTVEPSVIATGSKAPGVGGNPFSYAFPTNKYGHICLDISCNVMAYGKMQAEYLLRNRPLPENAFFDEHGVMTTDASKARFAAPFGGHKGYGLAIAVECMSSLLAAGAFGDRMGHYNDPQDHNKISAYFIAARIDAFRPAQAYREDADAYIEYLHGLPPAEGAKQVYFPGEIENHNKAKSLAEGVKIGPGVVEEIETVCIELGIPEEEYAFLRQHPMENP